MKQISVLVLFLTLFAVSCDSDSDSDDGPVTINGTWTLSTIQGSPADYLGMYGTIVIKNSNSFTYTVSMGTSGQSEYTGSVTAKSEFVYTLKPTNVDDVSPFDVTLSSDGKYLSSIDEFFGELIYTK